MRHALCNALHGPAHEQQVHLHESMLQHSDKSELEPAAAGHIIVEEGTVREARRALQPFSQWVHGEPVFGDGHHNVSIGIVR